MPADTDNIHEWVFSGHGITEEDDRVRVRIRYRVHVTPTQYHCPTCGQQNAEIHRIEIVEVVDEIAGKSIGWNTDVGAMVAWKVSAAHNQGKPICLTPACLEDLRFQNAIAAAC